MQRNLIIYFLISLLSIMLPLKLSAAAPNAVNLPMLDTIGTNVATYPVIRSEFTQTKQMIALKRPLVTRGHITYSRSHGVLWKILVPYQMSYVLTEDSIIEVGSNGLRRTKGLQEVPGLAQISRIFRAILSLNMSSLKEHFNIIVEGDASQWVILLNPKQLQLAQSLSSIALSGGEFVKMIKINETTEATTTLKFINTKGALVLSDAELQLLGISVTP